MADLVPASPRKYVVVISYTHPGTQPPIYVAGTFTTPKWEPHELHHTAIKAKGQGIQDREYEFHGEFEVEEGHWQYKLRAGLGDWWMLDERAATVTDDAGNRNNLLVVGPGTHNVVSSSATSVPGTIAARDIEHSSSSSDHLRKNAHSEIPSPSVTVDRRPLKKPSETFDHTVTKAAGIFPTQEHIQSNKQPSSISIAEEIPIPVTVVEKVLDAEPPIYGGVDRESLQEDKEARQADAEPDELVLLSSPASKEDSVEKAPPADIPLIVVEKADFAPSHGDDMGSSATEGQIIAHAQRAMDAEPDLIVVTPASESVEEPGGIGAPISKVTDAAAEVAGSTGIPNALAQSHKVSDHHPSTDCEPSCYVREAGIAATEAADSAAVAYDRIHMDQGSKFNKEPPICISEIANTAAEVADSVATIDPYPAGDDLATFASAVGYSQSDTESPRLEYAPLLPHERMSDVAPQASPDKSFSSLREVQASDDLDDPSLEPFPTDYNGILDQIRSTESHLDEDGVSVSTSVSRPRPTLRGQLSPNAVFDDGQSPVLLSITETPEEDDAQFHGASPLSLPEAISNMAKDSPQTNDEYFVGDEAAFTSSRSSRRSTISSRDIPQGRDSIKIKPVLPVNPDIGVEAIMHAHASSFRDGRSADSSDDNIAEGPGAAVRSDSSDPKTRLGRTTSNVQDKSASISPPPRSSDDRQDIVEHEDSHNHPPASTVALEGTIKTTANELFDSAFRQRKPILEHDVKHHIEPATPEKTTAHQDSESFIMAFWKALADWITRFVARLRG